MRITTWTAVLAGFLLAACGGGGGGATGTQKVVGAASVAGGGPATYHDGALPAAAGALTVTVPAAGMGINGGTSSFEITASAEIVTIYAAVDGQTGYWAIPVPAGSAVADVLLTFVQELGGQAGGTQLLAIVFEVADALGNISAPQSTPTTITVVGTGDVEVALNWTVANDLDLHVIDPKGNEVYFANPFDSTGNIALLDLDSNPACYIDNIDAEHIVWPKGGAPHGTYTVRVDNFENCQNVAASYTVTVQVAGKASQTYVGSFAATDAGDSDEGTGTLVATFTY